MAVSVSGPRLGIDFGSSNTVAVLALPGRAPMPLLFDGSPVLPSAVFATADKLLVGRDAERAAMSDPARFEPHPKRCIADGTVLLGELEYPVAQLIGAVLRRVADEATRVAGVLPRSIVLTHPAAWGANRLQVLVEAARTAGLPTPRFTPEPVAAASHFSSHLGHRMADAGHIVVYDLGGGTFDVSAVKVMKGDIEVAATGGLADVGGVDIDFAVVGHLERTYPAADDEWKRLREPSAPADRRHRRGLWRDVRDAKEILSRESTAALFIPLLDKDAHLTRDELEELARPLLEQTVAVTLGVLAKAEIDMESVAGLFLVGGASRMPLSSTMLMRQTRMAPTVLEQPELVVAGGAIDAPSWPAPLETTPATVIAAMPVIPVVPPPPSPVFRGVARVPGPIAPSPVSAPPMAAAEGLTGMAITDLAVDGDRFAVAEANHILIGDVATGGFRGRLGELAPPNTLAWSPRGDGALAAASGSTVSIWRPQQPPEPDFDAARPDLSLHCPGAVRLMSWSAGGLAVGDVHEILVWDPQTGVCARTWRFSGGTQSSSELRTLAWSPDGDRLAAGGSHGNIKIWDARRDTPSTVLSVAPIGVRALAWSPDAEWLVSGDAGGGLRIWQLSDSSSQPIEQAHDAAVAALAWSPDGKLLVSAGLDHTLRFWDAGSGRAGAVGRGHAAAVTAVRWSSDGHRVISAGADGTVRVWDAASGRQLHQMPMRS